MWWALHGGGGGGAYIRFVGLYSEVYGIGRQFQSFLLFLSARLTRSWLHCLHSNSRSRYILSSLLAPDTRSSFQFQADIFFPQSLAGSFVGPSGSRYAIAEWRCVLAFTKKLKNIRRYRRERDGSCTVKYCWVSISVTGLEMVANFRDIECHASDTLGAWGSRKWLTLEIFRFTWYWPIFIGILLKNNSTR